MGNSLRDLGILPGIVVSIVADTGIIFVGQVRGWRSERHHDSNIFEDNDDEFVLLQLTSPVGPYTVGSIIAIRLDSIISVGPVSTCI